ncbi:MAG TPA: hypothetical protein VG934_02900 [Candidatus Paceibacterota bacterium]|nr:hypothetical protein [Candidatus Paceibacterota bacterium]
MILNAIPLIFIGLGIVMLIGARVFIDSFVFKRYINQRKLNPSKDFKEEYNQGVDLAFAVPDMELGRQKMPVSAAIVQILGLVSLLTGIIIFFILHYAFVSNSLLQILLVVLVIIADLIISLLLFLKNIKR